MNATVGATAWQREGDIYTVAVVIDGEPAVFGTDTDPLGDGGGGLIISANDHARAETDWGAAATPGSPALEKFANPDAIAHVLECRAIAPGS